MRFISRPLLANASGASQHAHPAVCSWFWTSFQPRQPALLQGDGLGRVLAFFRSALAGEILALNVPKAISVVEPEENGWGQGELTLGRHSRQKFSHWTVMKMNCGRCWRLTPVLDRWGCPWSWRRRCVGTSGPGAAWTRAPGWGLGHKGGWWSGWCCHSNGRRCSTLPRPLNK